MTDLLVKLYDLKALAPIIQQQEEQSIKIRRALAAEKHFILPWVREWFSEYWVSECDTALHQTPVKVFIAIENRELIGFACYDATRRGFFGPTGVAETARGRGTGTGLLMACLHDMWAQGYGYAIIGAAGPIDYYQKACNAIIIPDSTPGVYADLLRVKS